MRINEGHFVRWYIHIISNEVHPAVTYSDVHYGKTVYHNSYGI